MKKKLFLTLLLFVCLALFVPFTSFAQTIAPQNSYNNATTTTQTDQSQTPQNPAAAYPLNTDPNVPQNLHTYTQSVFIEMLSTATCFISGQDFVNPNSKCLGVDSITHKIGYVEGNNGGLLTAMGGLIGSTYNIPVSTEQYGGYLADNFGITRSTYASGNSTNSGNSQTGLGEGIGFVGLTPVLQIWQAFRNLTYLVFVIIFVLLGLGIMFRLNIDARAVMTIQNQIPKIVIGLILITFSYAIAGLLVDLMYVAIYLIVHVFADNNLATISNISSSPVGAVGNIGGISHIATPAAKSIGGLIGSLFDGTIGKIISTIAMTIIGSFIGGTVGSGLPFGLGSIIGAGAGLIIGLVAGSKIISLIAMVIAYLIIVVALLSALFRVWFMLIKAYVFIFLDVIFGPFWILGGLLPGAPGGFGPWLRSLTANLAAFPVVILLFLVGDSIQNLATNGVGNFIPPLIGNPGSNSGEQIASLVGLGIILIMPEALNMTKSMFKAPNISASAAGRALGQGQKFLTSPIKGGWGKMVGEDARGNPRWLTRKMEERGGRLMAGVFGGGSFRSKEYDPTTGGHTKFGWFGGSKKFDKDGNEIKEEKKKGWRDKRPFRRNNNPTSGPTNAGPDDNNGPETAGPSATPPHAPAPGGGSDTAAPQPEGEGSSSSATEGNDSAAAEAARRAAEEASRNAERASDTAEKTQETVEEHDERTNGH